MTFPALPDLASPHDDALAAVRHRLQAVRASLQKACDELDDQIASLAEIGPALAGAGSALAAAAKVASASLFETEPVPPVPSPAKAALALKNESPSAPWSPVTKTAIVLEAKGPMTVAPDLEQATLEELNKALTKAFAQISHQHPWAG